MEKNVQPPGVLVRKAPTTLCEVKRSLFSTDPAPISGTTVTDQVRQGDGLDIHGFLLGCFGQTFPAVYEQGANCLWNLARKSFPTLKPSAYNSTRHMANAGCGLSIT